jgi:hypothetical protein
MHDKSGQTAGLFVWHKTSTMKLIIISLVIHAFMKQVEKTMERKKEGGKWPGL